MLLWLFLGGISAVLAGPGVSRIVCYVDDGSVKDMGACSHLVYSGVERGDSLEALLKEYRKENPRLKLILRVGADDKNFNLILKSKYIQGLELFDAHKTLNRSKVQETVAAAKNAILKNGGGPLLLSLPANPELLAKYYDFRILGKTVDLMMLQTHALGLMKNLTFHPSRLSGLWDMLNTDSVVDLAIGLGVPASKIVISLPASAHLFTLHNETLSTPGSPATYSGEIGQEQLCKMLSEGRWTLERDQDLSAPYAFKNKTWISFEDSSSVDVKGKYARVRGLAGLALHRAELDKTTPCGPTLRTALAKVLNSQSRAPRAVVLRSLEHEILTSPVAHARALDALQVSPYRITQVVDSDGVIHSIREDTRTEFSCSRQGYFVHPRSCARFYRCVKFDQLSPEYTVFEFDCPAGLAFDARYEVCVWPGSIPHTQACPGSSEIAPVPKTRFVCPEHEGYYADPENCRWFFACLDHGKAPLSAYEFRCPFGLGFDADKLKCDWPWLVPACGNIARYEAEAFGYSGAALTGAAGFHGQTVDSVNIAAHQSLVSGAALDNLVGIQTGFLSHDDALNGNFIASQEYASGGHGIHGSEQLGFNAGVGLVQATKYNDGQKYTSGSLILDEYRLPTKAASANLNGAGYAKGGIYSQSAGLHAIGNSYSNGYNTGSNYKSISQHQQSQYAVENQDGAYIHDPSGDYAEPYKHIDAPAVPYVHDDALYKHDSINGNYENHNGQYAHDYSGRYSHESNSNQAYVNNYAGAYNEKYSGFDNSGKYVAGIYRDDNKFVHNGYNGDAGHYIGENNNYKLNSFENNKYHNSYSSANNGGYFNGNHVYTGAFHTLAAGAVNVGLVGKTSLVDTDYFDQANYQTGAKSQFYNHGVSISHVGSNDNNYNFVTTPTTSGIPTTATPIAVTSSIPITTYKTTYVEDHPRSTVKEIFGLSQPVSYVTPKVEVINYNQALDHNSYSAQNNYNIGTEASLKSESLGYDYSKPEIKFEDGLNTYTTAAPIQKEYYQPTVATYTPHVYGQQTIHNSGDSLSYDYSSRTPVAEEPFKKIIAYTTGTPSGLDYAQSTISTPSSFSHETVHKVETANINTYEPQVRVDSGYEYAKPDIHFHKGFKYVEQTTAQPTPHAYSHHTIHKVEQENVNIHTPIHSYTPNQEVSKVNYSPKVSVDLGYKYTKPHIQFHEGQTFVEQVTAQPAPHSYSHQTIHKIEVANKEASYNYGSNQEASQATYSSEANIKSGYEYTKPDIQLYEEPKFVEHSTAQPTPHSYSQQTIHKVESAYIPTAYNSESEVSHHSVELHEAPKIVQYSTPQPTPRFYGHQTIHNVESAYVPSAYNSESHREVSQHAVDLNEAPKIVQYSTPQPTPHSYNHQTIHNVENAQSYAPKLPETHYEYSQPTIHFEEVEHKSAPPTVTTYSKPTYHHNIETSSAGYDYPKPTVHFGEAPKSAIIVQEQPTVSTYRPRAYSHHTIHEVQVSSTQIPTPAVSIYENPLVEYTQKVAPAVSTVTPITIYSETKSVQPLVQQHQVQHIVPQYQAVEQNVNVKQELYSYPEIQRNVETYDSGNSYSQSSANSHQVYHETATNSQSYDKEDKNVVFVSSTPSTLIYEDHYAEYEEPKKLKYYKAPEYIPPKTEYVQSYTKSTPAPQLSHDVVHATNDQYDYKQADNLQYDLYQKTAPIQQFSFSTNHGQANKIVESTHISSFPFSTYKPISYESSEIQTGYKAEEYLPPVVPELKPEIHFSTASTTLEYLPPTPAPKYNSREYLPPKVDNTYLPPSTTIRPIVKTTPIFKYTESTTPTYKAPEYLPPFGPTNEPNIVSFESFGLKNIGSDTASQINYNQYQDYSLKNIETSSRKHNIVVETSKSNLLGFGTVGPDAGLVSPTYYTTASPVYVPEQSQSVSTTYAPVEQDFIKITPAPIAVKRVKPKVAVVTKINDFNPLLVRKLGAVCSCQSPMLVLKGSRRNNNNNQDYDDDGDYYNSGRGDIGNYESVRQAPKLKYNSATSSSIVSSTANPIIVPDDSYYQDYQDASNIYKLGVLPTSQSIYSESFVSSTPAARTIKIRPRAKSVTIAPTYKSVLAKEPIVVKESVTAALDSQSFDRYGPGGWRSRDETLQGSVDCQRAGLFRHPKQCNKFYACRWDDTKQRFTLHVFNCPVQLSFDPALGACNWPSQGPACHGDTLLTNTL